MVKILARGQRGFSVTSRFMVISLALMTACASGLLVAGYPQAAYIVPVGLVVAAALLVISQRPEWGLLLSVFLIVVQRSPNLPVLGLLTASEVVFVLSALVWLAQNARQQNKIQVYASSLLAPFYFCTLTAVVSLLTMFSQGDIENGISELLARIYLMVFLVSVATYSTMPSRYHLVLLAWLISACLVVVLALLYLLFQRIGYDPMGITQDRVMFMGLYKYSTGQAGYVAGTILAFLPLALSRRRMGAFRRVQLLSRWCLPGLLLALFLTDSQGAYLGLAFGVLAWPFIRLSKHLGPILVILVLVVSSIALAGALSFQGPDSLSVQVLSAIGYPAYEYQGRIALLETRFEAVAARPITGVGLGQIGEYVGYVTGTGREIPAHFTPIEIAAETGVLGLLAVLLALLLFLKSAWENATLSLAGDSGWLQINEGLTIALIGMIIFGLAHDIQTNRTLWLVLALIVSLKPASLAAASRLSDEGQAGDLTPPAKNRSNCSLVTA